MYRWLVTGRSCLVVDLATRADPADELCDRRSVVRDGGSCRRQLSPGVQSRFTGPARTSSQLGNSPVLDSSEAAEAGGCRGNGIANSGKDRGLILERGAASSRLGECDLKGEVRSGRR